MVSLVLFIALKCIKVCCLKSLLDRKENGIATNLRYVSNYPPRPYFGVTFFGRLILPRCSWVSREDVSSTKWEWARSAADHFPAKKIPKVGKYISWDCNWEIFICSQLKSNLANIEQEKKVYTTQNFKLPPELGLTFIPSRWKVMGTNTHF